MYHNRESQLILCLTIHNRVLLVPNEPHKIGQEYVQGFAVATVAQKPEILLACHIITIAQGHAQKQQ